MIDADRCGSVKKRGKGKGRKEGKKRRKEAEVNERKTQIRTDSGAVRSEDELHGELKANAVDGGYKAAYIPLIRTNSSPSKSKQRPSICKAIRSSDKRYPMAVTTKTKPVNQMG